MDIMDGGNKTPINLEAGLNINTSDMLVPLSQQSFQHNWQKFQGKFLPNSLRFEKNGWAAGWNVYNFKYNSFRKHLNDIWLGALYYNTDGTRLLSVYESEDSQVSKKDIAVNTETKIKSISGYSAYVAGDGIAGTINGKNYNIAWDINAHTATIDNGLLSLAQENRSDYSTKFTITDTTSSYDMAFLCYLPSQLTGDAINSSKYTGFDGTKWSWDLYTFDGTNVITPDGAVVTPTVDGNTITFDYSTVVTDETANIKFTLEDYYVEFDVTALQQLSGENYVIAGAATNKAPFNRYTNKQVPSLISSFDTDFKTFVTSMPVWLTMTLKSTAAPRDAQKCDNVAGGCVQIRSTNYSYVKFDALNIYGDSIADGVITFADSWGNVPLISRFNRIQLQDALGPGPDWAPYEHIIAKQYPIYGGSHFWGYNSLTDIQSAFGLQNTNALVCTPENKLDYNPWTDFSDPTSHAYDDDISGIDYVSVVAKGEAATTETSHNGRTDLEFALDECNSIIHPGTVDIAYPANKTVYSSSQAYRPYSQLYSNGKYIGSTYESTTQNLSDDNSYWPFTAVPKFNIRLNDGTTVAGAYWSDGVIAITDLTEFKEKFGIASSSYSESQITEIVYNGVVNRHRVATHFNTVFDFVKYTETSAESMKFKQNWQNYYPSYDSPQNFSETEAADHPYDAFNDTSVDVITPEIWYVQPGQEIVAGDFDGYSESVPFGNAEGVILYEGSGSSFAFNLYHQNQHAESVYNIFEPYHSVGHLWSWFSSPRDLYDYYGKATSMTVKRHHPGQRRILNWNAQMIPASCGVHVNYTWERRWHPLPPTEHESNPGYWEDVHVPMTTVNPGCWIKAGYFGTDGSSYIENGPRVITDVYSYGSIRDGFSWALALEGWIGFKVRFPQIKTALEITSDPGICFLFEKVTALDVSDDTQIWLTDAAIGAKSYTWISPEFANVEPDNGEKKGHYDVNVNAVNDFRVFYAKAVYDSQGNEILSDCYIPPIAFSGGSESEGNMESTDSPTGLQLTWIPDVYKMPSAAATTYSPLNSKQLSHKYFTTEYKNINMQTDVGGLVYRGRGDVGRELIFKVNDIERFRFEYNCQTQSVDYTTPIEVYNSSICTGDVESVKGVSESATIDLTVGLNYPNNVAKFTKITEYTMLSDTNNIVRLTDGVHEILYDYLGQAPVTKVKEYDVTSLGDYQSIKLSDVVKQEIIAFMHAAYDGVLSGTNLIFSYRGNDYTFNLNELNTEAAKENIVEVTSTDIRKPTKSKLIGKIVASGKGSYEYQLVKQQWNTTVEVENFWWINDTHVLELNQEYFVLKRKTDELDDWAGDRFEKIYELPRVNFIDSTSMFYTVTNVYGTDRALFFKLYAVDDMTIGCTIMDPIKDMKTVDTVYFRISTHSIGDMLNVQTVAGKTAYLNTYNKLSAHQILTKAVFSNAYRDGRIILGIHQSNNYDQWAAVYNVGTGTFEKCIQGYGYVGVHGDLTGGQLPKDYFDINRGFNSKVEPIEVLTKGVDPNDADSRFIVSDPNRLNDVTAHVVGTAERQWYVAKQLYGIVSHLKYTGNGNFAAELLPITNKYTAIYKSPSFGSARIGDMMVEVFPFANLLKLPAEVNSIWQTFMTICGYPCIYMFNPRFSYLNYMQQSVGQYSYVHYNSSESMPEKEKGDFNNRAAEGIKGTSDTLSPEQKGLLPLLNDSYTFDKQILEQHCEVGLSFHDFGSIIFAAFAGALQMFDAKQSVNEEQKQTATSDLGRKYVSNVMANADALLASSIMTQSSCDAGVVSKVAAIKSLDMFYSTSDQQRVFAGPGFVEHQMVANCVAQSSTDTQVEGKVSQLSFTIRALTEFQQRLTNAAMEATITALEKLAEAWQGATGPCSVNYGAAIAVGLLATAAGLRAALAVKKVGDEQISKVMDVICQKGITVSVCGGVTRHAMNPEGKHKYGEKPESFMWPCWGATNIQYTDETVNTAIKTSYWKCTLRPQKYFNSSGWDSLIIDCETDIPDTSSTRASETFVHKHAGSVPFYQAACYGSNTKRDLPDKMAKIEGVETFLPDETFKNENIAVSDPVFTSSLIHDYIIDEDWDLSQCATYSLQQWVTVKDTKITNCPPSNIIVHGGFCGVATPYEAVEVKRGLSKAYMRPWAITPNTLAFNCTGLNTILDNKLYHAFDGISYRIVDLVGTSGMNKVFSAYLYAFQVNDRFKRSNICPANEVLGNFNSEPVQDVKTIDKLWTAVTQASKMSGLEIGTVGEDKDAVRWAIPIFTEQVSLLPAAVKTMTACTLAVSEGITCLVTAQVTDTNAAYKAPLSVDFTIGKNVYRKTEEYICSVTPAEAGNIIEDITPALGLMYIGATPTEAFFYSKSTRCYYSFTGANLTKLEMMERFRNIQSGHWDFVNQEVVMPCLMTFKRLNAEVEDKDTETDNIIVPVLSKGQVSGELPPPITTIFNDRSWYKCVSLPSGLAYQGPNRVIINRAVFVEYMLSTMKQNLGKWKRMDREKYVTKREYPEKYKDVVTDVKGVEGWTYNPFVLVTSALGQSEDTDCVFEWTITFCWPIEMDLLYGQDNYAAVNIVAETMTPGGKVVTRPTHVYLTKELFTRNGNYGYYSFRYQSKNGAGNRERLHIWSDQYIAISAIDCEAKVATNRRTEQLTQQMDVQKLKEL